MTALWRVVALSDHHPAGTCWAWMDGAERVCGSTEDPATPHLCPRHAKVARRRAEKEHAKDVAWREKVAAKAAATAPARQAERDRIDARIARLTGGGTDDPASVNLPLAKRLPSDAQIHELAQLVTRRARL